MKIANILLITTLVTFLNGCSTFNERSIASEDDYEKITPQFQTFLDAESKHNPGKAKFDQKPLDLSFVEIEINDEQMYLADSHDASGVTSAKITNWYTSYNLIAGDSNDTIDKINEVFAAFDSISDDGSFELLSALNAKMDDDQEIDGGTFQTKSN